MMNQAERKAFNSQFWRFLWSAILIALSGCLGNVVDAIIVGNLIGEDAVSAINLTRPVVQSGNRQEGYVPSCLFLHPVNGGMSDSGTVDYSCRAVLSRYCYRLVVQQCSPLPADVRVFEYYADWCPCIYDDVGPLNDGGCGWQSETRLYCS